MVAVPDEACGRLNAVGEMVNEKSLTGEVIVNVTVAVCVWPPPVPVTVIV